MHPFLELLWWNDLGHTCVGLQYLRCCLGLFEEKIRITFSVWPWAPKLWQSNKMSELYFVWTLLYYQLVLWTSLVYDCTDARIKHDCPVIPVWRSSRMIHLRGWHLWLFFHQTDYSHKLSYWQSISQSVNQPVGFHSFSMQFWRSLQMHKMLPSLWAIVVPRCTTSRRLF